MPKITANSMIAAFKSFNKRVGFFYKAGLVHVKHLIKIDSSIIKSYGDIPLPPWAKSLNKIFLDGPFGNLIHTANSFVYVAKVINCACNLVDLSIQKNKEYKEILDSFETTPMNPLQLTFYSNLNLGPYNNAQDIITTIENALLNDPDLQGKDKEHKEKRKKLKQKLSFIYFCSENPIFAESITIAETPEEKILQLQSFLNGEIAKSIQVLPQAKKAEKWKNKLVKDWRKQLKQKTLAWLGLSTATLTLLTYATKPLLWAIELGLVVSGVVIATAVMDALTMAFAIVSIVVGLLNIAFGLYTAFDEMSTKIPKKWAKKADDLDPFPDYLHSWDNELTKTQKFFQYLRYFFTDGYYGDVATNLAVLLANVALAALLLAGISMPWVVITLSAAALTCGIIAFIGALHKEIKETKELTVFKILMGTLKVLLIGGTLTALSVAAFVSPPLAVGLIVAALVGGIAYAGILWYNRNNTDSKLPAVGPRIDSEIVPLLSSPSTSADHGAQPKSPYACTISFNDELTSGNDSPTKDLAA